MDINLSIAKRLKRGRELARMKFMSYEASKAGNLRAGNSGVMSEDGEMTGACHRITHLRQLGIEASPPEDSQQIMFQMGFANEDLIFADLKHTFAPDEVILREEQIPITWTTSNGTKVTGRPDMVICRTQIVHDALSGKMVKKDIPIQGIEIKSIASVWTSKEVLFDGSPKLDHVIQSAHYAWKLNIPYKLIYKQYAIQTVPAWANKMFPRKGHPGSEFLEYNPKGEVKSIKPFEVVYDIFIGEDGQVSYKLEDSETEAIKTIVNVNDINRFYEFVSTMGIEKKLGPPPTLVGLTGKKKDYKHTDYCLACKVAKPLEKLPDSPEKYDQWLAEVKKEIAANAEKPKK